MKQSYESNPPDTKPLLEAANKMEAVRQKFVEEARAYLQEKTNLIPGKTVVTHSDKKYLFVDFEDLSEQTGIPFCSEEYLASLSGKMKDIDHLYLKFHPYKNDGELSTINRYFNFKQIKNGAIQNQFLADIGLK